MSSTVTLREGELNLRQRNRVTEGQACPSSADSSSVARGVRGPHGTKWSLVADASTLRVVLGTGVYLTLIGLLGSAFAWIVRSTPGALVATYGVILVVPILFELVFPSWGDYIAAYLPTGAGQSFSTTLPQPHSLPPWVGLGLMLGWVALGLVTAGALLRRRDA